MADSLPSEINEEAQLKKLREKYKRMLIRQDTLEPDSENFIKAFEKAGKMSLKELKNALEKMKEKKAAA